MFVYDFKKKSKLTQIKKILYLWKLLIQNYV